MKKVSLSVHKSNIERRERKQVRSEMTAAAKSMAREQDIVSYAIVGFDRSGNAFTERAAELELPDAIVRAVDAMFDRVA